MSSPFSKLMQIVDRRPSQVLGILLVVYGLAFTFYSFQISKDTYGPHDGNAYHGAAVNSCIFGLGTCGLYENSYWTPMWVETIGLIYRLVGPEPKAVHIFNILIILSISLFLYLLAMDLWGPRSAILAPLILMTTQLFFKFSSYLQYEIFLAFLLTLFLFKSRNLIFSKDATLISACSLGLLVPVMLLVSAKVVATLAFVVFYWWLCKRNRRHLYVFLIVAIMGQSLWIYRNYECFDKIIPITTNGGVVFFIGNNPNSDGSGYNDPYEVYENITPGNTPVWDQASWYQLGANFISENPILFLKRFFSRFIRFFNPHYADQIFGLLLLIFGAFKLTRRRHHNFVTLYGVFTLLGLAGLHGIYLYSYRYSLPSWPMVALIGSGLAYGWRPSDSENIKPFSRSGSLES